MPDTYLENIIELGDVVAIKINGEEPLVFDSVKSCTPQYFGTRDTSILFHCLRFDIDIYKSDCKIIDKLDSTTNEKTNNYELKMILRKGKEIWMKKEKTDNDAEAVDTSVTRDYLDLPFAEIGDVLEFRNLYNNGIVKFEPVLDHIKPDDECKLKDTMYVTEHFVIEFTDDKIITRDKNNDIFNSLYLYAVYQKTGDTILECTWKDGRDIPESKETDDEYYHNLYLDLKFDIERYAKVDFKIEKENVRTLTLTFENTDVDSAEVLHRMLNLFLPKSM